MIRRTAYKFLYATDLQCFICIYQVIIASNSNRLGFLLKCSEQEAKQIQEAAQRYLDEKRDVKDALAVVQLLRQNSKQPVLQQSEEAKRKKAS